MANGILERLLLMLGVEGDEELDEAAEKVDGLKKGFYAMSAAAVAAGAGLSIASASAAHSETVNAAFAESLGVTADEYRNLVGVMEVFGLESQDVAQVLNDVFDRTQELVDGSQSWVDDFKLLGLGVQDFAGKNAKERLDIIGEAFRNTEDRVAASAAMMRLLGGDAIKLIPMLSMTREAVAEMEAEFDRLAGVTDAQEAASFALTTNLRRLRLIIDALGRRAMARLWPALERATDRMIALFDAIEPGVVWALDKAIGAFAVGIDFLTSPLGMITAGLFSMAKAVALGVKLLPLLKVAFTTLGPAIYSALTPLLPWIAGLTALALVLEDLFVFFRGGKSITGEAVEGFIKLRERLSSALGDLRNEFADFFNLNAPAWLKWTAEYLDWIADSAEDIVDSGFTGAFGDRGPAVQAGLRGVVGASPLGPAALGYDMARSVLTTITNEITITSNATDPVAAGQEMYQLLQQESANAMDSTKAGRR